MRLTVFFLGIIFVFSSFSKENETLKKEYYFLKKARELKLSENVQWRKILFYQKKYFASSQGIVGGELFYLAGPRGRFHLQAELEATIHAFFFSPDDDTAAQCRFPRRLQWLKSYLEEEDKKIPEKKCEKLKNFTKFINPTGLVLVFSSFFMNNPSSMFGHTFLRIINSNHDLTDFGVNFAANPDTQNMFLYAYKGIFGRFKGYFSLLPYFVKVQEYNNSESRDLWEYTLQLTPKEIFEMLLSLWEVGDNPIDYYYFDQNCSFVLLALLETARFEFSFTDSFWLWVNPADTLRVLYFYPNLVQKVNFRPSSQKRFWARYDLLNAQEKELFRVVSSQKISPHMLIERKEISRPAHILDALLEYIDFKERIAGTGQIHKQPQLRQHVLKARASVHRVSDAMDIPLPAWERPEQGVPGARMGVAYQHFSHGVKGIDFVLRPVLHHLQNPAAGYSPDSQIELLSTVFRYEISRQEFFLQQFHLVNLMSIAPLQPPLFPLAWNLKLGTEQDVWCPSQSFDVGCQLYFLNGGLGVALRGPVGLHSYFLTQTEFAYQNQNGFYPSTGFLGGILFRPREFLVLSLEWKYKSFFVKKLWQNSYLIDLSFSYVPIKNFENKIFYLYRGNDDMWQAGMGIFWHFF
jgi:hypothetical protein